jgi:tRNA nucleotidyltransferase/poly(A) polymerase
MWELQKNKQNSARIDIQHSTFYILAMPVPRAIIDRTVATAHGEAAYKIVEALTDAGHDAWWVGGAARDMLHDVIPDDIDIATDAVPDKLKTLFPKADMASAALGSVRVTLNGTTFEVTTFREDDEASDGRHPESVTFGARDADAKRRDFTVNAIYVHPISRETYDPFGGEADWKERLVRFIGEPAVRIKHDALRLLRAVRLRAKLDGQYHPETYAALRELAQLVEALSGQRQLEELEKMLAGPRPDRAFEDLWELGMLSRIAPELHACKGIAQPADYHREGDVWEHTLQCMRAFRDDDDADVRLAAVFHDCGKPVTFELKERIRFDGHATASAELTEKALARFQCPAKRAAKIAWLVKHHMMMGAFFEMPDERKSHWYHHPWFADLLRVFWLDVAGTEPADFGLYEGIVKDYHTFLDTHPRPEKALLSGAEVMDILGISPGEEVGRALKLLHDAQTRKEVNGKQEAKEFVKRLRKA